MSTTGIIGTLDLAIDEGENEQDIASLLSCRLAFEIEMLPALHPSAYGWAYFVPGNQDWRGEAAALQLVNAATGVREEYLQLLEEYFFAKTLLTITFTSPSGETYASQGYIDTFQLGGAEGDVYAGSFGVQGTTSLTLT